MTTEDYLTQLQQDREDLVDNLEEKGITGLTGDETFTELVPEVLNISEGGKYAPRFISFNNYGGTDLDDEIENLDTSNITSMLAMFSMCSNLLSVDLSDFDTSNVTSMNSMFNSCTSLTELNINSFDLSSVITMNNFIAYSSSLEDFTMTNKTTSNLKELSQFFAGCTSLNDVTFELTLNFQGGSGLNNRIIINSMFNGCSSLTELDLSKFVISTTIFNTSFMFQGCTSLVKLDIRNLNLNNNIFNYTNMFGASSSNGVPDNCEIIVKDDTAKTWVTSKFTRLTNVKTVAEYEAE